MVTTPSIAMMHVSPQLSSIHISSHGLKSKLWVTLVPSVFLAQNTLLFAYITSQCHLRGRHSLGSLALPSSHHLRIILGSCVQILDP